MTKNNPWPQKLARDLVCEDSNNNSSKPLCGAIFLCDGDGHAREADQTCEVVEATGFGVPFKRASLALLSPRAGIERRADGQTLWVIEKCQRGTCAH